MGTSFVPKNTTQKISGFPVSGRVTNANIGIYTCPVGKRAKVTASMNLDAIGADASYALAIKTAIGTFVPIGQHVTVNNISTGEAILEAGDILTNIGDGGSTNGTADIYGNIQELPA